jgi:hypothetical protein
MKYLVIYWIWIKIIPFQLQLKSLTYMISQKNLDKFFIETNISVFKKNVLLKNYFLLKDDKNYAGGLCIKIHFICLSNARCIKKISPKIYQNIPKKNYYFCLKQPLCSVLSPFCNFKSIGAHTLTKHIRSFYKVLLNGWRKKKNL